MGGGWEEGGREGRREGGGEREVEGKLSIDDGTWLKMAKVYYQCL